MKDTYTNHWGKRIEEEAVDWERRRETCGTETCSTETCEEVVQPDQKPPETAAGVRREGLRAGVPQDAGCVPALNEKPRKGVCANGPGIVTGRLKEGHYP